MQPLVHSIFDAWRKVPRQSGMARLPSKIELAYETFGHSSHPAFLLIMGNGGQRIFWPTEFCEKLARKGFYVIRYDQRDSGESSHVDYAKEPYDLLDLAKDALALLDALKLEKSHLMGLSMGAAVAELLAVLAPERFFSLTLMSAPADFEPIHRALLGQEPERGSLSSPKKVYLDLVNPLKAPRLATNFEERLEQRMRFWQVLGGSIYPFENSFLRPLHTEFFQREKDKNGLGNYRKAIEKSKDRVKNIHAEICLPTLILHGSEDPLFGIDHQKALQQAIKKATLLIIVGLGHLPHPRFSDFIAQMLAKHARELPLQG